MVNSWTLLNIYEIEHLIGDSLIKLSFFPFIASVEGSYICTHMDKKDVFLKILFYIVMFLTNHLLFR